MQHDPFFPESKTDMVIKNEQALTNTNSLSNLEKSIFQQRDKLKNGAFEKFVIQNRRKSKQYKYIEKKLQINESQMAYIQVQNDIK